MEMSNRDNFCVAPCCRRGTPKQGFPVVLKELNHGILNYFGLVRYQVAKIKKHQGDNRKYSLTCPAAIQIY